MYGKSIQKNMKLYEAYKKILQFSVPRDVFCLNKRGITCRLIIEIFVREIGYAINFYSFCFASPFLLSYLKYINHNKNNKKQVKSMLI